MTNAIVSYDVRDLIDQWMQAEQNGEQFPVDFDIAWQIAGYSTKQKAQNKLKYLKDGEDFLTNRLKSSTGGRPSKLIEMTCDAFKHFCLLAETEEGHLIRQYFIEAEKKWRIVQTVAPEVATQVEILKLQADIAKANASMMENQRIIMERSEAIATIHGLNGLALIQGRPDAVVYNEITVTEVVEPETGKTTKILTSDQLKRAVLERTGQKLKSMKAFTDALRERGRDDLLVPVKRLAPISEYVQPDKLDEAIRIVYGKQRQTLIGE